MSHPWDAESFEELFRATAPRLRNYVARQIEHDLVDDVVSETYCLAWRNLERIPSEPLGWLIGVSRNCLRRQWRQRSRSEQLWLVAVREQWRESPTNSPEDGVLRREEALAAFAQLSEIEREALLLTAWDGLAPASAAKAAGCSTRAFTVRLSRARANFNRAISQGAHDSRVWRESPVASTNEGRNHA